MWAANSMSVTGGTARHASSHTRSPGTVLRSARLAWIRLSRARPTCRRPATSAWIRLSRARPTCRRPATSAAERVWWNGPGRRVLSFGSPRPAWPGRSRISAEHFVSRQIQTHIARGEESRWWRAMRASFASCPGTFHAWRAISSRAFGRRRRRFLVPCYLHLNMHR
jgi:hypothetical protein